MFRFRDIAAHDATNNNVNFVSGGAKTDGSATNGDNRTLSHALFKKFMRII